MARVRFREFRREDWRVLQGYQNDPRYLEHYPDGERSPEVVRELVERFVAWQADSPRWGFQFVLERIEDHCLIGTAGLRVDLNDAQAASIGIELDPETWGQGMASEAMRILLAWGQEILGLRRIEAACAPTNGRVHRLLEAHGFRRVANPSASDATLLYRLESRRANRQLLAISTDS